MKSGALNLFVFNNLISNNMKKFFIITTTMLLCFFQAIGQNKVTKHLNLNQTRNNISISKLLLGKWQSVDDKTNYIVFENNLRKEIADGIEKWNSESYVLSNKCLNESDRENGLEPENNKYISCKESDMCWYIVNISKEYLTVSYLGRGNTLKFKKVK